MRGENANRANRIVDELADFCRRFPVEEKWLLVPNYRAGYQWLENVAFGGTPVFNLRMRTLPSLCLELAFEAMEKRGLRYIRGLRLELMVAEILARFGLPTLDSPPGGTRPDLARAVTSTLLDVRLSGLEAEELEAHASTPSSKTGWLVSLLRAYEEKLAVHRAVDYPGLLRMALGELDLGRTPFREGLRIAIPESMLSALRGLERALWKSMPTGAMEVLEEDSSRDQEAYTDASLLRWINRPTEAPPPPGDGTVEIFRATGETNEVREVLRRSLQGMIPFDRVEILYTDYEAYVPRLYELCSMLFPESKDRPPITFAEGIPVRLTRPGRALLGWIHWIREDFSQQRLAEIMDDGLIVAGRPGEEGAGLTRAAALFRTLPIGSGRERYHTALEAESRRRTLPRVPREEEEGMPPAAVEGSGKSELATLRELCSELLSGVPEDLRDTITLLRGARDFLSRRARSAGEADQYALHFLLRRVGELEGALEEYDISDFPALDWLEETVLASRVLGEGPRPGCLHAAPLFGGGRSGRPWTFVVGLDDGRFPGAVFQDPLLADEDRQRLSPELATSFDRISASVAGLSDLFASLRGKVTLSYSGYHLREDREMFPSQVLLTAYRLTSGVLPPDQEGFLRGLPAPACFAAAEPEAALFPDEWWMSALGRNRPPSDPENFLRPLYPHLSRGLRAARARAAESFTPYDGYVPEAGRDLDPASEGGPVVSPSRLETYGRCPLEYFLRYVLEVEPFDEYLHDARVWLNQLEKGSLLHSLFHRFHRRLRDAGELPSVDRHREVIEGLLEEEIRTWCQQKPPPSQVALQEQRAELLRTAYVFLHEEELFCRERKPLYFEVSMGMGTEGPGNPVDHPEPLVVGVPGIGNIKVRGRIDRIDLLEGYGKPVFLICDYKTGSSKRYNRADPFLGGRCIQNYLYTVMAEGRLREEHPGAEIAGFEFFFPGIREHGERITWDSRALREGDRILGDVCAALASGCFLPSDNPEDLKYSDYREAFGDLERTAAASRKKLACEENEVLEPLRRLRGYREDGP